MGDKINRFSILKDNKNLIPLSDESYDYSYLHYDKARKLSDFDKEEIEEILLNGEPEELRELSLNFYYSSGIYRNFITYFSNLLTYAHLLVPIVKNEKKLSKIEPVYEDCLRLVDNFGVETRFAEIFQKVLTEGGVYGLIKFSSDKKYANIQFLPYDYSRARFRTLDGIDIVEFDVQYFDTHIFTEETRKIALKNFPKEVQRGYEAYSLGKGDRWVPLEAGYGFHFCLFEERPFFINSIPSIMNYDDYQVIDKRKQAQDLKKILVHELPTYQDQLVIDPEEGLSIHDGVVKMLGEHNPDLDVITTWGKAHIEAVSEKENQMKDAVERSEKVVYAESGLSSEIFAAEGNLALGHSLEKDLSNAMYLANKIATWFTYILNVNFETKNSAFSFKILPISNYNRSDMFKMTLQAAQTGYSFLLPALCEGLQQSDLSNIKFLENNILNLGEIMTPLKSSYTSSGSSSDKETDKESTKETKTVDVTNVGGRTVKEQTELNDRTIENKESL